MSIFHRKIFLLIVFQLIAFFSFSQLIDTLDKGYTKYYYPNGEVISEGVIEKGKPNGYWKTYYPHKILKSEGNRINFKLEGLWLFYNNEGDTIEKIYYRKDKKNGFDYKYIYKTVDNIKVGVLKSKELFVKDKKENKSFYYTEDGFLFEIVNYNNNKKHGLTRQFDESGKLISVLLFKKGVLIKKEKINRIDDRQLKQGIWRDYFSNDRIKYEAIYLNNELHGYYKEWNIKGQLIKNIKYFNGVVVDENIKKQVKLKEKKQYYENGNLKYKGNYRDTVAVGIHRKFNENSELIESYVYDDFGNLIGKGIIDEEGNYNGKFVNYYVSGDKKSEGNYSNGNKNGLWKYYYKLGAIEQEGYFRNGKIDGTWKWYYESGKIKREENYIDDREDGLCIEYAENGDILVKGEYIDGLKEDLWINNVGEHVENGYYKFGQREGRWEYYYANGKLKFEGNFLQGKEDGKHKWYYSNGKLKEEKYYIYGSREKIWKYFDEEGNLFLTILYRNNKEIKINGRKVETEVKNNN